VLTGGHVPARGADLDRLRRVVDRAADLSAGLADALHHSAAGPPTHRHLAGLYAWRMQVLGAERLLDRALEVERAVSTHPAERPLPPAR
jgi:hypothetical protein